MSRLQGTLSFFTIFLWLGLTVLSVQSRETLERRTMDKRCMSITLNRVYESNYCARAATYTFYTAAGYEGTCTETGDCQSGLKCCSKDGVFCAWEDSNGMNAQYANEVESWESASKIDQNYCEGIGSDYQCIVEDEYYGCY